MRAMCHAPIDPDLAPLALFRSIGDLGAFDKAPKAPPASSFQNKLLAWRIAQEMPRAPHPALDIPIRLAASESEPEAQ